MYVVFAVVIALLLPFTVQADECETSPLQACVIVDGANVDLSWLDLPGSAFFCTHKFQNGIVASGNCYLPFSGDPVSPEIHVELFYLSVPGTYEFMVTQYKAVPPYGILRSNRLHVSCAQASDGFFSCQ